MNKVYRRGEMHYAYLNPVVGSEQGGYRPVVILQNNKGNDHSPTVIVAPITSRADVKPKLPTHYYMQAENGLEEASIILLEQIRTIDKCRLGEYVGKLNDNHVQGIDKALKISLALTQEKKLQEKMIMTLCPFCLNDFYNAGVYVIKRTDPLQIQKETCTYCGSKMGFDYEIRKRDG